MSFQERDFGLEITHGARLIPNFFLAKIPDVPRGPEQRFSPRRGFDYMACWRGRMLALELKIAKKLCLPFNALDEYQKAILLEVADAGGHAFVVVNFRVHVSEAAQKKQNLPAKINSVLAVPIRSWETVRKESDRESITLQECFQAGVQLERMKIEGGYTWDLRPLCQWVIAPTLLEVQRSIH